MAQSVSAAPTAKPAGNLSYATHWDKADAPSALARFHSWASRFTAASNAASQTQTLAEGVALARERRTAFALLLKSDPQEALAATVPAAVRARLPTEIINELETRVSGVGDYSVLVADPFKGGPTVETLRRVVRLNGRSYRAQVYGRRLGETTKQNIPLHGVALDGVLALAEGALRQLEPEETPNPAQTVADLRPALEKSKSDASPVLGEMGGRLYRFSSVEQLRRAESRLEEAEAGIGPNPRKAAETIIKESAAITQANGPAMPRDAATSWTTGNKSVLVIRVDFSDLPGDPHDREDLTVYTADYCQTLADTQISPYYQQSSYGLTTLSNTVTQLYRMPQPAVYYATHNANDQLHLDAEMAASADYAVSNFDRVLVLFSPLDNLGTTEMNYGGLAEVGGRDVWVNGEFDFRVVAHELGHTYGLYHANLWQVSDGNPISANGINEEYGDEFDTMSANYGNDSRTDFNPWFKNLLGWIPDAQVQTVMSSGIYRVNRFDDSPGTGTLALKVVRDSGHNYWIGVRRNFTDNPSMEHGAYVIWGYNQNRQSDLLDLTTPGVNELDAALAVGATFTDPDAQIFISPVDGGGTAPNEYLDVQINVPPIFIIQPTNQTVTMEQSATFSVSGVGDPAPGFQWQEAAGTTANWTNLTDDGTYSGSQTSSLIIDAATLPMDGDQLRCVLSNSYASVLSSPAVLTVNGFPVVGSGDQIVQEGQAAMFSVKANFLPAPTYQWQRQASQSSTWNNLADDATYIGSTTPSLLVSTVTVPMNGDQFRCLASNQYGSIPSPPAILTVESFLLENSGDQTVQQGQLAAFSVTAAFLPAPAYQWEFEAPGGTTWSNLRDDEAYSGTTTSTLNVIYPVWQLNGCHFQCVACNAYGCVTSTPAMLRVEGDFALMVSSLRVNESSGVAVWGSLNSGGRAVRFNNPAGIAVDAAGNVYVANAADHTIQVVASNGVINTLAGLSLHAGSSNGMGANARFNSPSGIAVDHAGTIYVADTLNDTIRKVAPNGMAGTLAGRSRQLGSSDGLGTNAFFNRPGGVAVDAAGNVFVADTYNDTIRRITPEGAVTTLAGIPGIIGSTDGSGTNALFNRPAGIALDQAGNLYVADTANNTIRKLTPDGAVSTLAGRPHPAPAGSTDQIGANALFNHPSGLAVDGAGNIFVADTLNDTLREISPMGAVSTRAGVANSMGMADGTNSFFNLPGALAMDPSGKLFVADTGNDAIREGTPYAGQPLITQQPQNQQVFLGSSCILSVAATGTPPLAYQWQKDGIALKDGDYPGATTSMLLVMRASAASAGAYSVAVSNVFGVTLSQPAMVRVPVSQQLGPPVPLGNGLVKIAFRDQNGLVAPLDYASGEFKVQASTNLVQWATIPGSFVSTNGFLVFTETPPTNQPPPPVPPRRFYRIRGE